MGNINPFKGLEELVCQTQRTQEPIKGNSGNPIDNIAPIVERVIQQSEAFRLNYKQNSNPYPNYLLGRFLPENDYLQNVEDFLPLGNYRSSPIHATFLVTPKNGQSPVVMSFGTKAAMNHLWHGNITITRYNTENNSFETRVAVVPTQVTSRSGDLSENIRKMIEALNKAGYEVEQIPLSDFNRMLTHPSNYPKNYYYQNPLINPNPQKKSQSSTPITTISSTPITTISKKEEGIELG
jgi:hypothetical protein